MLWGRLSRRWTRLNRHSRNSPRRGSRACAAPLDSIRVGWAGSDQPRQPHYFRIQGANFLIEFDNSGGNHIHSVWRDFEGDFGRDVLRDHYRGAEGTAHRHGKR
jgi:hypothetical protein